jgi:ferredoxin-NADP reductase
MSAGTVRITDILRKAEGVVALELHAADGRALDAFTAGSHIDVELPVRDASGRPLQRQYSLCNDPSEQERYVIGVGRDAASRGGSLWLHEQARVGDMLQISAPRNHFELDEDAEDSILVAGGIGITPLLAMARRLSALGKRWTLYYCARTPERAAFLDELEALPGKVVRVFDGVPGGAPIELPRVVADAPRHAHLYCCGPVSMLEAFQQAAAQRDPGHVHVEWFKPRQATPAAGGEGAFQITLARTGLKLDVPAGKSILDILLEAGVPIQHSCCDGVCGTCETRVLGGVPEHRDSVLFGDEAGTTGRMMVCVSRSASPELVLDL